MTMMAMTIPMTLITVTKDYDENYCDKDDDMRTGVGVCERCYPAEWVIK